MEKLESINVERIKWCCKDRGITPQELAEALRLSWVSFQNALAHQGGLTFNQLRKVAEYFNRSTLFFLETGQVIAAKVHTPQFRTLANQKPDISAKVRAIIERVEKQRDIYLSLLETLDDADVLRFDPPAFNTKSLRQMASITRNWLDLSTANDFASYRRAVESKGVLVFRSNGYNGPWQIPKTDSVCGFTVFDARCPVVVVKKMPVESHQVFTLMHELGHVLLDRKSFIDDDNDLYSRQSREKTANAFAGLLLVPDEQLNEVDDGARPSEVSQYGNWLRPLTQKIGISPEVVLRRLMDSGRISRTRYEDYREWRSRQPVPTEGKGNRAYRHREPRHVFGDPFVGAVLDALHAKKITLAKASTYLDNLKISDLHQLEDFYAGV
jgi:Zn-dependent peptidase ImmA (M78 family)